MMIRKLHIPASLALAAFFGCSTGTVLLVDDAAPRQAYAQDVDDGFFYANLAPHGQWFYQAQFGWVWHPARVNVGWRPYTEGQWVYANDVGWTWASQEPWGWATYHYGRWYFDPMYGWSWVPGRTWAPAWVSWRVEAGYIGWAPLWPAYFDRYPENRWDRWRHDGDWDRRHRGRDWDRWVFTRDRDFTSDRVGRRAITDRRERDRIFRSSRDVTQYDEGRPERIGHSIDRRMVENATGRPVRPVRIEAAEKPGERDNTRSDSIRMFRPRVKETSGKTPDRLGLAKEPARQAREADTIRQEKKRLDSVPDKDKDRGRDRAATEPTVREKDNERGGGGPADNKPERAGPGMARPDAREPAAGGHDKRSEREPSAGKEKPDNREPAGKGNADKSAVPERRPEDNPRGTQEKAKSPERGATMKSEREQRPVEAEREAKPASRAEPAAREQPPSRAEQPSRRQEAPPQVKSGKAPTEQQTAPRSPQMRPERTQKQAPQQQMQPERTQDQAPKQHPERTQKQAPRQQVQPERTPTQAPKQNKQPERNLEPSPRESRPTERAPQVEQRSAPQQRQADAPTQGRPESGKDSGKKNLQQDVPDDAPQRKGKN